MKWKAALLIVLTVFLVLVLGLVWQINETQRTKADYLQFWEKRTVQPNSVETERVILSLTDNLEEVSIGQEVTYTIFYRAKRDLKDVRIVGALGETKQKVYPTFAWELGDLKRGATGSFSIPVTIKKAETDLAVSRVSISEVKKPSWWGKEQREILATVDDLDKVIQ